MEDQTLRLREMFDAAAERYDTIRPGYQMATIDDLIRYAGLVPGSRVLEIGCGTGQLTVPLAERGLSVTAVELGPALAAVARRNLSQHPEAQVIVGTFEDAPLGNAAFDLIVAATSFHWIDRAVRVPRAASLLRPGGTLAVIDTEHVAGGTTSFFVDAQTCYERWDPATPPGLRLSVPDDITVELPDLAASSDFEPAAQLRYIWEQAYTSSEYLTLLQTYSGHLALSADRRRGLLGCIGELIDRKHGGSITKAYMTVLHAARRR